MSSSNGHRLFQEQVAELIGVEPGTVKYYNSRANAKRRRDKFDIPKPVAYVPVERAPGRPGPRVVKRPVWDREQILAWRSLGRRPPKVPRERDRGRYAPRPLAKAS